MKYFNEIFDNCVVAGLFQNNGSKLQQDLFETITGNEFLQPSVCVLQDPYLCL